MHGLQPKQSFVLLPAKRGFLGFSRRSLPFVLLLAGQRQRPDFAVNRSRNFPTVLSQIN
jgi:hypothetical protein